MKKLLMIILALIVCMTVVLTFVACDKDKGAGDGTDTSAQSPDTTAPEVTTAVTTAETTTEAGTTVPETTEADTTAADTQAVTTAEITTGEVTTEDGTGEDTTAEDTAEETTSELDPVKTLVPVATSYDGKTKSYDARYDFTDDDIIFTTKYGTYYSLQDAIDDLEGEGGGVSVKGDMGICLDVKIPDDGCNYLIFYNYFNCDFTFNFGLTYDDDCVPHGYAYRSDINELDSIGGLDGTHIYVWTAYEGLEPGYYLMHDDADAESIYNYRYERIGAAEDYWPGLVDGEAYFG